MNAYPELFEDRYKIVFVHLPKTGGKTFRQIVRKQYKNCIAYRLTNEDGLRQLYEMSMEDIAMLDFIHGHFPVGFLPPHMPKRFRYFTWLRDPVERTISTYNYWIHSARDFNMPAVKMVRERKMSFQEYLDTDIYEIRYWLYPYLNLLGLGAKAEGNPVEVLERGIEQAARVLLTHFDFVGITERYDEGLKYLQRTYGFRTDYTIQNVTPNWAKKITNVTQEQKDQMREILNPEYLIYDFAKKIFEERIKTDPDKVYAGDGIHEIRYGRPKDINDADIEETYLIDRWGSTASGKEANSP